MNCQIRLQKDMNEDEDARKNVVTEFALTPPSVSFFFSRRQYHLIGSTGFHVDGEASRLFPSLGMVGWGTRSLPVQAVPLYFIPRLIRTYLARAYQGGPAAGHLTKTFPLNLVTISPRQWLLSPLTQQFCKVGTLLLARAAQ